jgi:preprotein translocase subunit YajC
LAKKITRYFSLLAIALAGLLLLSGCIPTSSGESQGFNWTAVIMVVVLILMAYFLLLRPARKRQADQQKLIAELKPGDQVIAAAGIYGVIDRIDDESVVIIVESGAKIRVLKQGLITRRSPDK